MNKQQTAVEWLINELHKTRDWQRVINEANQIGSSVRDVIKEAKEMEKERMIGLLEWMNSVNQSDPMRLETDNDDIVEQYYNETYGGNK